MLDIIQFNKPWKSVHRYLFQTTANLNESCFFDFYLSKIGGKLVFLGNLAPKDARTLCIKDVFIQELIEPWTDLNQYSFASQANFSASHIRNNSMIRIAGKTIFYNHWADAGVMKINDRSDDKWISIMSNPNATPNVSPFRNPSPPTQSDPKILHFCPVHTNDALEKRETMTERGHWEYCK